MVSQREAERPRLRRQRGILEAVWKLVCPKRPLGGRATRRLIAPLLVVPLGGTTRSATKAQLMRFYRGFSHHPLPPVGSARDFKALLADTRPDLDAVPNFYLISGGARASNSLSASFGRDLVAHDHRSLTIRDRVTFPTIGHGPRGERSRPAMTVLVSPGFIEEVSIGRRSCSTTPGF
jgi:hypothetical protein